MNLIMDYLCQGYSFDINNGLTGDFNCRNMDLYGDRQGNVTFNQTSSWVRDT